MAFVITPFLTKKPSKYIIVYNPYRYYWERRQPVDPDSTERFVAEETEIKFQRDF